MAKRGAYKRRRKEAATEFLAEAAERVVCRLGYQRARMADVAREAGCAAGTLYLHFRNKEQLFNALVARHCRALAARLDAALTATSDPLEKLSRKTAALLDYFNGHRDFFRFFYTASPGGSANVWFDLRDEALVAYLTFKKKELAIVKEAQRLGRVREDIPADELTEFIQGITLSTLARWSSAETFPAPEEQFRLLWSFLTGGLKGGGRK